MTQMTAQVFFVAASAKDAVLVPLAALRPVRAREGGSERAARAAGRTQGRRGERAPAVDPRSQFANGRALVSVVGADGKVADRDVKVGVMNRVSAQILSGLEPGEKVVIGTRAPAAAAPAQAGSALAPERARRAGGRP